MKKSRRKPDLQRDGFSIWIGTPSTPKRGKQRIWIAIRQDEPKEWRVYETLSYAKGVDVQFVKEP